jgi:aminomethyltransferase
MLCSESGGILDDIFLYRLPQFWLMVVNAANRDKDWEWLSSHARGFEVTLRDRSDETCMIALQGPAARDIIRPLCSGPDPAALGHGRVEECRLADAAAVLCSTGYTGEPGLEILIPADGCERIWSAIIQQGTAAGLVPCGLASRDSLRAEACLPLYGHEIDESTDPFSAGLARAAVSLEGHDFIGKRALREFSRNPPARSLAFFEMIQPGVPRHGYAIAKEGQIVGRVTTGLFGPSIGRYIAMGWIDASHARVGTQVDIVIREATKAARVVERPFYRSPHWR